MEKQEQVHDQALKCPRCDSSNTKFCYYNNYSLSQPRHFCKACKRYWTKGGILRNIPVGGGCRKNKKIKRPSPPPPPSQIDISEASNHINPVFYGLPKNPPEINPTYSGLTSYDRHPQLNDEIQNIVTSSSLLSESYSLFGSSSSNTSPTMASLNAFQGFLPFKELQMESSKDPRMGTKEVKMEERTNLDRICNNMEWNVNFQNQMDLLPIGFSDQSLYWNVTNMGAWPDVTPLI